MNRLARAEAKRAGRGARGPGFSSYAKRNQGEQVEGWRAWWNHLREQRLMRVEADEALREEHHAGIFDRLFNGR